MIEREKSDWHSSRGLSRSRRSLDGAMWNEAAGGATFRMSGPAVRMKARVDHRVPVSRRAMKILRDLACDQEWVTTTSSQGPREVAIEI